MIEIVNRWTKAVLYKSEDAATIREAVVAARASGADLRDAYLGGANLNWTSHDLLSEILWRAADTEARQMVAAYIGRRTDWCWSEWAKWEHPEREWARTELAKWVKDGDGAPGWIRPTQAPGTAVRSCWRTDSETERSRPMPDLPRPALQLLEPDVVLRPSNLEDHPEADLMTPEDREVLSRIGDSVSRELYWREYLRPSRVRSTKRRRRTPAEAS